MFCACKYRKWSFHKTRWWTFNWHVDVFHYCLVHRTVTLLQFANITNKLHARVSTLYSPSVKVFRNMYIDSYVMFLCVCLPYTFLNDWLHPHALCTIFLLFGNGNAEKIECSVKFTLKISSCCNNVCMHMHTFLYRK